MVMSRLARPNLSKLCYRREGKSIFLIQTGFKLIAIWSMLAAYVVPFFLIPHTIHPVVGWGLYLLGSFSLSTIAINAFHLPMLPVLTLWLGILGTLLVMAYPWYHDGVVRALSVFAYAFCYSPLLCVSYAKIMSALQVSLDREVFLPRLGENGGSLGFNKLYWWMMKAINSWPKIEISDDHCIYLFGGMIYVYLYRRGSSEMWGSEFWFLHGGKWSKLNWFLIWFYYVKLVSKEETLGHCLGGHFTLHFSP